jgi:AMMECR1 domain-containing protein
MLADIVLSESLGMHIPWRTDHKRQAKELVPLRSFGVFVTARRARPLPKHPEDIHGCIGYWSPTYQEESRDLLLEKACEVGYKAFWEDSRREAFSRNILQEPDSFCEIDFLMLPVVPVDSMSGRLAINNKPFDNGSYGLIVEGMDRKSATYLPGVFPQMPWKVLKQSLLEKANSLAGRFYAYKIRQLKIPIGSFCDSPEVALCLKETFKRMLFQHARKSYPFFPLYVNRGKFRYAKEEDVRNTGLLLDLVEAFQDGVPFSKAQETYLTHIVGATERLPLSDQAKAFLLPCLSAMGYRTEYMCRDLVSKLRKMDREFQFGETVVGIAKGGCKHLLLPHRKFLLESYPLKGPDSIFQLNWDCQALVAIGQKPFPKPVLESLVSVLHEIQLGPETFTNVLAVSWEVIQTVYPYCSVYFQKQLDFYRLYICWLLQQRIDDEHPTVYKMLTGEARLDITSHVLGGWTAKFEDV